MNKSTLEKIAFVLVLLMILLQSFYGIFAYVDASAFSNMRGTELFSPLDTDWVSIYGSRTIFIALVLGYLLYFRHYFILMWCALFGIVMPATDAFLAYQADAPVKVIAKHIATILYLLVIGVILKKIVTQKT